MTIVLIAGVMVKNDYHPVELTAKYDLKTSTTPWN